MVKVVWNGMTIEGTPEEVRAVIQLLGPEARNAAAAQATNPEEEGAGRTYIGYETARTVLTRRPLHALQKKLFRLIYEAHPNMISGVELQDQLGYSRPQFSGLMGALGRRLAHTEGFVPGQWLFRQDWNDTELCYYYGLPETLKSALEDLGVVGGVGRSSSAGK